ncbi:rhodopsin, G0-coupled [Magallana gigas]|uniref:rhodopsin, G0-coupled n=1 Tax=Magallana gigas TaxID=29159 RepID=UPI0005C3743B
METFGNSTEMLAQEKLSAASYISIGVYMIVLTLTAILGNCLVLFVYWKRSLYKRPVNWFILNISVADLCVALFAHPLSASASFNRSWNLDGVGCQMYGFFCYIFACNNIMTYAAISYFRYQIVCENNYVARIQRGRILSVLISIWMFSLFWTVSPLVGWNGYELEPYRLTCSIRWYGHVDSDRAYICLVLLCVYVFPLSVMIFSYIQIARHARRLSCTYPSSNEGGNKAKFLYNLERGATKISLLMTLSFVFTWTPYAFMSTVAASGVTINSPVVLLPTLFAKSSCAYNPFVFFFSHSAFKSYHFGFSSCIKTPETQEHPGVYVSNVRFRNRVGPSGATHATSRAGIRSSTEAIPNGDHSKVIQISVHPVQQSNVL